MGMIEFYVQRKDEDKDFKIKMEEVFANRICCICKDLDTNGDGYISAKELADAYMNDVGGIKATFQMLGLSLGDTCELLAAADIDGDGEVAYQELASLLIQLRSVNSATMTF